MVSEESAFPRSTSIYGTVVPTRESLESPSFAPPTSGIGAATSYKLRMSSRFHDTALVKHVNDIGVHGGGETVCDHEPRFALGESREIVPANLAPPMNPWRWWVRPE